MGWVESQLNDETIFPIKFGQWNREEASKGKHGSCADANSLCQKLECADSEFVFDCASVSPMPARPDSSYPKKFHSICSTIYKRFFRVYAHIYHARTFTQHTDTWN